METSKPLSASLPLEEYSRRTVRAWWADGLWDLVLAGFWILTALWIYPLVWVLDFPSWTWPWPFITQEHINPLADEIALWAIALIPIWIAYLFLAKFTIDRLKRRFIAPRLGDVRHKFFLPIGRGFIFLFLTVYMLSTFLLGFLFWKINGGLHLYSVVMITSFAGVLFLLGRKYHLPRYSWIAIIGSILCFFAELLTTNAVYMNGPQNFMDVSPFYGNPSLACFIWAMLMFFSGIITLRQTLRLPYAED
jgi:hypothetical protein